MDNEIDPVFANARKQSSKRRRRSSLGKWLAIGGGSVALVGGIGAFLYLTWDMWSFGPTGADVEVAAEELAVDMVALEQGAQAASSAFAAAFVDLAGDPMLIRFAESGNQTTKEMVTPGSLGQTTRISNQMVLVSDVMVSTGESFITTLPSSQDDFAFFKAQRKRGAAPTLLLPDSVAQEIEASGDGEVIDDSNAGWGDAIGEGDDNGVVKKTRIENNTSLTFVKPEKERRKLIEDNFTKVVAKQEFEAFLKTKGFSDEESEQIEEAAEEILGLEEVDIGHVVAIRTRPKQDGTRGFAQMSVYGTDTFYGTLAINDAGEIGEGSDPWVEDELFDYSDVDVDAATQEQKYRMLDAFYSTAIRNRVPATVVGEAIALLSKSHDLDKFANPGDRMNLLYGTERLEDDTGAGQLLYIAIKGKSVDVECFVYRNRPDGDYECYGVKPRAGGSGGARPGFVTPVQGVLTSRFGPRNHPILKTVRNHNGVDWAAPTGTPVSAAFDGVVSYTGPGGGYGNLIKIRHANGMETRYAHLHKFESKTGDNVRAGDIVGLVGTTGRSTGPHLHFELYVNGTPVDPLTGGGGGGGGGGALAGDGSGAVETLVNQIIRVESAGNANAKNPLSTATGLGQFIEGTWIRMMKTYRPDLASSLSKPELLALRTDPTISREMVKNLAREGESYLRARGHSITAGRLYLCHFLGAQGAHLVLASQDEQMLLDVLGSGVINANPFLRGKNVAYIKEWAERKMRGRKGAPPPVVVAREPNGLKEFRKEIQILLGIG
jgi:murein DD-endopeptidase MepM/ murein hydrolase activator NlpD